MKVKAYDTDLSQNNKYPKIKILWMKYCFKRKYMNDFVYNENLTATEIE